jgi:RNA recognition motif-containing protein
MAVNNRIFVGNLKYEVTDDELRDPFEGVGPVASVEVVRDANGKARFAFIEMVKAEDAELAIENLMGFQIRGRAIRCEPAKRSASNEFAGDRNRESADHARPGGRRWA